MWTLAGPLVTGAWLTPKNMFLPHVFTMPNLVDVKRYERAF